MNEEIIEYLQKNSVLNNNKYHLRSNDIKSEYIVFFKSIGGKYYKKNNLWSFSQDNVDHYIKQQQDQDQESDESISNVEEQQQQQQQQLDESISEQQQQSQEVLDELISDVDEQQQNQEVLDESIENENIYHHKSKFKYNYNPSNVFYHLIEEYLNLN